MPNEEYLFSYGTLQKEEVQINLFGKVLESWDDMASGYKRSVIEITDHAFLSRGEEKQQHTLVSTNNKNDRVKGKLLKLTPEELLLSDQYEPANYKRVRVILESGKGAWLYTAVENK